MNKLWSNQVSLGELSPLTRGYNKEEHSLTCLGVVEIRELSPIQQLQVLVLGTLTKTLTLQIVNSRIWGSNSNLRKFRTTKQS